MQIASLPSIRSHERITYKRCPRKWYWAWRMGLVPKAVSFGPLELGNWMHAALANWYGKGFQRVGELAKHLDSAANRAMEEAYKAPSHVLDKASEIATLGVEVAQAYERHYGEDEGVYVLGSEVPLNFDISEGGRIIATHRLKPDLVFRDPDGGVWLMEHKTAAQISTTHLSIDDQARPYGVMSERALRKKGIIKAHQEFKGIIYNFLRKALPDLRETNAKGQYLNKDGSVSKRQPSPQFVRHRVTLSRKAKVRTLRAIQHETLYITLVAEKLRNKEIHWTSLPHTPHKSCPKLCPFFSICEMTENGLDIQPVVKAMFTRRNPYLYDEENPTTDEPISFEVTG